MTPQYLETFEDLVKVMKSTIQFKDIDVLQHGFMVRDSYQALVQELESGEHPASKIYFQLKDKIVDSQSLERYHIYHDCGKALCKEDGRFPDHETHSYNQWKLLFPDELIIAELMKLDMSFHVLRGDDIKAFWSNPLAPTLYFTAWAELEANASMFGGRDSDSYKIKRKRLIKAGKLL